MCQLNLNIIIEGRFFQTDRQTVRRTYLPKLKVWASNKAMDNDENITFASAEVISSEDGQDTSAKFQAISSMYSPENAWEP